MEKLVEKNPVTKFYSILQLKLLIFKTCVETYILLGEFSEDFSSNLDYLCTYHVATHLPLSSLYIYSNYFKNCSRSPVVFMLVPWCTMLKLFF